MQTLLSMKTGQLQLALGAGSQPCEKLTLTTEQTWVLFGESSVHTRAISTLPRFRTKVWLSHPIHLERKEKSEGITDFMLYSLTVSIFPNWFLISIVTWKGDTAITLRKWKTILFPQIWITCRQVKSTVQWIMWPWSSYNSFEFYRVVRGPVSFDKHLTAKISPEQLSWTFDLATGGITLPVKFASEAKYDIHSFLKL